MANDLVAYSRAGDVFHYRWAARRCLHMIYPNSTLRSVFVEGSNATEKEGEYVIDVTEYHEIKGNEQIDYYQLKHSTVQVDDPFTLSDLKDTFEGFAKRYLQHYGTGIVPQDAARVRFIILTNRLVSDDFQENIQKLGEGKTVNNGFLSTIKKYTKLEDEQLKVFCSIVEFQKVEQDYRGQKVALQTEISELIAGTFNNPQLDSITALVQEKVLPDSNHKIIREEILQKFGITSERELYPAPPAWEQDAQIIAREQHKKLKNIILQQQGPFIVHAGGGVGKSVFCRHLADNIDKGSLAIAFDCFGAGDYRNRSTLRHGHRSALVQICNELAARGLCPPLLLQNDSDEQITRAFLQRIEISLEALKLSNPLAKLIVIVDAADNAEMAAIEFNQNCFAHEIMREKYPTDFRLVLLCRTERISLLQPLSNVIELVLSPFSETESYDNLREHYLDAKIEDGLEFHRLTSGNPRVQANALYIKAEKVSGLLESLGPAAVTVEDLIEQRLQVAINRMKDSLPAAFNDHIHGICTGLASLPPHIPLFVLSAASGVDVRLIESFVADIGRSLWLSDGAVQFRDEPTETWFKSTFTTSAGDYNAYIERLEPLAGTSTYVAESLPMLYLQAGAYDKLLQIALSDDMLPKHNPIDERNVRVYRLKFAFQAALRLSKFGDAIKLGMRTGEEVAGDQRQLFLLKENVDLLSILQSQDKAQQIAYRRLLRGSWPGAENIYSACVLSFIPAFRGEARSYIRSAHNWLHLYFAELREKQKKKESHAYVENLVQTEDIFELAFSILNVNDAAKCFNFLSTLNPRSSVAEILKLIINRLIDHGRYDDADALLDHSSRVPEFFITIVDEMMNIGRIPKNEKLETMLGLLANKRTRIRQAEYNYHQQSPVPRILSFLEACLHHRLSGQQVKRVLKHYCPEQISKEEINFHSSTLRTNFFRALAIRSLLADDFVLDLEKLLPEKTIPEKKTYKYEEEVKEYRQVINALFPWFSLRIKIINGDDIEFLASARAAEQASNGATTSRYQTYDFIPGELVALRMGVLALNSRATPAEADSFYRQHIKDAKDFNVNQVLDFTRIVFRAEHLKTLGSEIEIYVANYIKSLSDEGPDEISSRYIRLARAVVNSSVDDASVYFDEAIRVVSKFGDEILSRWNAISDLAERSTKINANADELAYRFIRCAEVVGSNAREKHWSRDEALRICIRLSPNVGLAALSRWRDRRIGYFDYLLKNALRELLSLQLLSAKVSWGITKLMGISVDEELIESHLKYGSDDKKAIQMIFGDAVETIARQGYLTHFRSDLEKFALAYDLSFSDEILQAFANQDTENRKITKTGTATPKEDTEVSIDWDEVFGGIDLISVSGLQMAHERLKAQISNIDYFFDAFCKNLFARCDQRDMFKVIAAYFSSDFVYYSQVPIFFSAFPDSWSNKVSFKKQWPDIVGNLGEQFAFDLHTDYSFRSFCKDLKLSEDERRILKLGMFKRFSQSSDDQDADFFFHFVSLASSEITDSEASKVLDYSLSRFELHIEDDFGDGPWSNWLYPTGDLEYQIAGFLWSALGSPWISTRWQAAHAMAWLGAVDAACIFDNLFKFLKQGEVAYFGSDRYPFYNLHARLYFLIGCSKIATKNSIVLLGYADEFLAFAEEKHALIQRISANIIENIERNTPGTYDPYTIKKVWAAVSSPFAIREVDYNFHTDSYWHKDGNGAVDGEFFFGIDFPQYWYEPLGRVFGVTRNQTCDLAKQIILKDWKIEDLNGYQRDPRRSLWNSSTEERATWHDHGSYPKVDTLDFYHSYHAMFIVAANLLEHMPILQKHDYEDDEWSDWLKSHRLTFENGDWISDFRGRAPIIRPKWIYEQRGNEWKERIKDLNLLDQVTVEENGEHWLYVYGGWHELNEHRIETNSVSSAFVNQTTSSALLNALSTCENSWDYFIPSFSEQDHDINAGAFELKGWLYTPYLEKGIDQFDIEANDIAAANIQIGAPYREALNLIPIENERLWLSAELPSPVMESETYSTDLKPFSDDRPDQTGHRMKISMNYLLQALNTLKYDLILLVTVSRNFTYRSDRSEKTIERNELFLIKPDGTIRTTKKSYRLR